MSEFEYLKNLNKGQYEAATTIEGPVRILAGAGSGKTHTLIHRVAYMVDKGIPPEQILLLTFTNNAAQNMVDRAATMANPECKNITACTYHSFCAMLLRRYGKHIGLDENFTIITPSEVADAIKLVKSQDSRFDKIRNLPLPKKIADIYSKSVNMMLDFETTVYRYYKQYKDVIPEMQQIIFKYIDYKEEKDLVDYDDLLTKTLELLQNDQLRDFISDAYKYIMVDEYQDSNTLQEKIVFLLAQKHKNLAIVGDDYQSIYAFRGSDINNILDFPDRFSTDCKTVMVNVNYRSTEEILNVANSMMDQYADFGCKKTMVSNDKHGEKPILYRPESVEAEAEYIVNTIEKIRNDKGSLNEIAILERNSTSSFRLEAMLDKNCIPYQKLGGLKFMEMACILDMLAFMRAVTNNKDELAFYRILDALPYIGEKYAHYVVDTLMISGVSIASVENYKKNNFYNVLCVMLELIGRVKEMKNITEQYDAIYSFYIDARQLKIKTMRTKNEDKKKEAQEKLEHDMQSLSALRDMVVSYDKIVDFLDDLMLDANKQQPTEGEMVTISTIHSAKGMEWDTVFMLDCMDGVFPKMTRQEMLFTGNKKDYLEELRCFYVAVTRAKTHLHVICPEVVMMYGKSIANGPSHFLDHSYQYMKLVNGDEAIPTGTGRKLNFELVPQPLWNKNLRSMLNSIEWDNVKANVNDGKCCICGKRLYTIHIHEFWGYDDENHVQKLLKVGPVCEQCHAAIHIGNATTEGKEDEAFRQYMKVNHCSAQEAEMDYHEAITRWKERNKYAWKQDINLEMVRKLCRMPEKAKQSGVMTRGGKTYLKVPFAEKDAVKQLGARWDPVIKMWYVPEGGKLENFAEWL